NRLAWYLALVLLAGCTTSPAQREGLDLIDSGQFEAGLAKLEQAARESPNDVGAQMAVTTQRARAVKALLSNGDLARTQRDFSTARLNYERVLRIEKHNQRALDGLHVIEQQRNIQDMLRQGQTDLRRGDVVGAA